MQSDPTTETSAVTHTETQRTAAERRRDFVVRRSLRSSVYEGAFAAAMAAFGEAFFGAYALLLKAGTFQLGLLGALPPALGAGFQFFSNRLIGYYGSRKRLVASGALLQALMYIPVLAAFFFSDELRVWLLLVFICLYYIFGSVINPAWNSWMGDLVVENRRGAYFGKRSTLTNTAAFLTMLIAGCILRQFEGAGTGKQFEGFVLIFLLAVSCRMVSLLYLARQYEPRYRTTREADFSFLQFLQQPVFRNYRSFVLYLGVMNFGVFISAPFFTPYMLHDLHMDYLTFTCVNATAIIVKVLSLPVWGKTVDRFGARRVMSLAGYLMPLVPVLWVFSGSVSWLFAIQAYSGFIWAGFDMATVSFIFDITSPEKRVTGVAYYNIVNGVALIAGAMFGSIIVKLNLLFVSPYLLAFLASGLLRLGASLLFLPRLAEVRSVENIAYPRLFLKVVFSVPAVSRIYEMIPFQRRREE